MANVAVRTSSHKPATLPIIQPGSEAFRLMRDLVGFGPFREIAPHSPQTPAGFTPSSKITETKDAYLFKADVPGVKDAGLDVTVTGNRLTISRSTATPRMKCIRTERDDTCRLSVAGALDALSAPDIRPIFEAVVADGVRHVTLDLDRVTFIDSSGIGAIVSLYKGVKADRGQFAVVGVRDQPLAVFKVLELDRVFGL